MESDLNLNFSNQINLNDMFKVINGLTVTTFNESVKKLKVKENDKINLYLLDSS